MNLSTLNPLRRRTMLRDHGLDRPLEPDELALRLLALELRLEHLEVLVADSGDSPMRDTHAPMAWEAV